MCFSNCTFYGSLVSADSSATEFNDTWHRATDAANCFFITQLFGQNPRGPRDSEPDFPRVLSVISASLFEQGLLPVSHARKPTSSSRNEGKIEEPIFYACNIRFLCVNVFGAVRKWKQKNKHPSYASWKGSFTCTELRWRQWSLPIRGKRGREANLHQKCILIEILGDKMQISPGRGTWRC